MTAGATTETKADDQAGWVESHHRQWKRKPALRAFYEGECFARMVGAMPPGRSLEIGAGPGFFTRYHRCDVVSDVTDADHVDRVVDAHDMPFEDRAFSAVIGLDVVHHFRHPARALSEISRVLAPGGRLILVEPWTGPAGWFVNKYLHDEDCFAIADPWGPVFVGDKDPMDGNATIAKTIFADEHAALPSHTGLDVVTLEPFSCLGYLATGGFTRWQLPRPFATGFLKLERALPTAVWRPCGLKVFVVAERVGS